MDYNILRILIKDFKNDIEDDDGTLNIEKLCDVLRFFGYNPVKLQSVSVKLGGTNIYHIRLGNEGILSVTECENGQYLYMFGVGDNYGK